MKWGWVDRTPTLYPQTVIFASPFLLCLFQTTLNLRFNMVSRQMSHYRGKGHVCLLQKGYRHCQCRLSQPKLIRTLFLPLEMHQTNLKLGVQYEKEEQKPNQQDHPPNMKLRIYTTKYLTKIGRQYILSSSLLSGIIS